jgi:hypothetical protein
MTVIAQPGDNVHLILKRTVAGLVPPCMPVLS